MATSQQLSLVIKAQNESAAAFRALHQDVSSIEKQFSGLVGTLAKLGAAAYGIQQLVTVVKGLGDAFLGDAIQAEKVSAQLDAVLKSTGSAAGLTRQEVLGLSDALAKVTAFEDETITKTQSMLLTFMNIGRDIMPEVTEAVLNMATAMDGDLQGAAIRVGKALQDPIAGVAALRKVGVQLSDEQQQLVKDLIATGQGAEAQRVILKELETEFGNSARAAGDTFAGQLVILNTQLGNVKETIGGPVISALSGLLKELTPQITAWAESEDGAKKWAAVLENDVIPAAEDFWEDELKPMIEKLRDDLPSGIEDAKVALGQLSAGLKLAAQFASGLGEGIDWVLDTTTKLIVATARLAGIKPPIPVPSQNASAALGGGGITEADRNAESPSIPLVEATAAEVRAAQRAVAQANTWYWANSDDPEAVAWRASQIKPGRGGVLNAPDSPGGARGSTARHLTAAEGFMSALVGEAANMDAAFGAGGKLASALIAGMSADIAQAGSAGKAVGTAMESLIADMRAAGVVGWREMGDELSDALHDALIGGTPDLRSAALEQVRAVVAAINEAQFWKGQGVAADKMAETINEEILNTAARIGEIQQSAEAAKQSLEDARALAESERAIRGSLAETERAGLEVFAARQSAEGRARLRRREDAEVDIANARTLADIETAHIEALERARRPQMDLRNTVASEVPRLQAERAEKDRYEAAKKTAAIQMADQAEARRTRRANEDSDLDYSLRQAGNLEAERTRLAGITAAAIRTQIEEPAFQRQLVEIGLRAQEQIDKANAAQTEIERHAIAEYDKTTAILAEKWKIRFGDMEEAFLIPAEERIRGWADLMPSVGVSGGGSVGLQSFASGGVVSGPTGMPSLAIVHGGERVTPSGGGGGDVHISIDMANATLVGGPNGMREFARIVADVINDKLKARVYVTGQGA